MKKGLIFITLVFCLLNNAYGKEAGFYLSIIGESIEHGSVAAVGFEAGHIIYLGLSLNYIKSSNVIQNGNRKTILPLYFVISVKAPWKISPFVEVGSDIGDAVYRDLFHSEEDAINDVDYYYSGGIEVSINDKTSFVFYSKKYNFLYREFSILNRSRPDGYGAGVLVRF